MVNTIRLLYFDFTKGNKTGLRVITEKFGLVDGLWIILKLQYHLLLNHPFRFINSTTKPTKKEKLSQRQMAPVIVLHRLLMQKGIAESDSLHFLQELSNEVATEFLKFNVPIIDKSTYFYQSQREKLKLLQKITDRFFNAEAELTIDQNDNFEFTVKKCHFANYAKLLGVEKIAPLFCAADKRFFDDYQEDIVFFRSKTQASDNLPCDFRFTWRE